MTSLGFDLPGYHNRLVTTPDQPVLMVIVDTEEEFDWNAPFNRASTAVSSVPAQDRAQEIYTRLGVTPTYVIDYAVADDPDSAAYFQSLREQGACEIGAHLHPWVTPPHEEKVNAHNSFHGNLPADLERRKLRALTARIEEQTGERPMVFKAGRYGLGPHTCQALIDEGYKVDCSVVPFTDFSSEHGPAFKGFPDRPYWIDSDKTLLEIPLSRGFSGALASTGPTIQGLFDSKRASSLRLPGILFKLGLIQRATLTPEGVSADDQIALLNAMVGQGHKVFSLTYHSPSLAPGNTPYVRTDADLAEFLARLERVLTHFKNQIGGTYTTPTAFRKKLTI